MNITDDSYRGKQQTPGHRSNNFDFLRFFFAALVIFSHSFDLMGGKGANPISQFTRYQIDGGSLAVDGFFIISGFLVAKSFVNSRSVLDYFKRRILRIYPGFFAAAVVSLAFFGWLGMHFFPAYWQMVEPWIFLQRLPILKPLWIPQTFHDSYWPVVNGPIWTIQYEFVCYILIALLGLAWILRRRALLLILFASALVFYVLQIGSGSMPKPAGITLYNWKEFPIGGAPDVYPRFLSYFLVGTIAFLYRERITYRPRIAVPFVVATLIIARLGHGIDVILPFSLCYLVLFVAFFPRIPLQNWAKYGDFSYGLYLCGWPVQQSVILICHAWITPWLVFVLSLPFALLFAIGSWYLIERRFLRLKKRHLLTSEPRTSQVSLRRSSHKFLEAASEEHRIVGRLWSGAKERRACCNSSCLLGSRRQAVSANVISEPSAFVDQSPKALRRFKDRSPYGRDRLNLEKPRVEGKFLAVNGQRFWIKAVSYGTFKENARGEPFPPLEKVCEDFEEMRENGVNSVRLYSPPSDRVADAAARFGLYLIPDIMWGPRRCELDDPARVRYIFNWVSNNARRLAEHPAILMFSIGNEIPPLVARWYGKEKIERFLYDIYHAVREYAPETLVTYAKHPPTEYLHLPFLDIDSYNIYLERESEFRRYLARLHQIGGERPLFISELGVDAAKHGPEQQAEMLRWQLRAVFEKGACGAAVYTWTDEWAIFEQDIWKWRFGITDINRNPRPSLNVVKETYSRSVYHTRLRDRPRVSIVVPALNAEQTIDETLSSLSLLNYPDYEVIVVNDGSNDNTGTLARRHKVRVIDTQNQGLSAARNVGIEAATGDIVAFIDSDAFPDPDWLLFLVNALDEQNAAGVGGPNLIPSGDGFLAQCIDHAPGNPTHVLFGDELAEHVPGCNMGFKKQALVDLGAFDPQHRVAGDDVDICWKLLLRRKRVAFSPCAIVWHHRRSKIRPFLKQQTGYGRAEAHLHRRYPGRFNLFGDMAWAGKIYDSSHNPLRGYDLPAIFRPRIYQGFFGSAQFQSLYQPFSAWWLQIFTKAEWQLVAYFWIASSALAASLAEFTWPFWLSVGVGMLLVSVIAALIPGIEAARKKKWQGPRKCIGIAIVAFLHIAQPLARMLGFVSGWWATRNQKLGLKAAYRVWGNMEQRSLWLEHFQDYLASWGWRSRASHEWDNADIDILGPGPYRLQFISVYEERLERGFHMVRFRVNARPKVMLFFLWIIVAILLAVITLHPYLFPFIIPIGLVLLGLLRARRHMLSAISQLALECAESLGMSRVVEEWFV